MRTAIIILFAFGFGFTARAQTPLTGMFDAGHLVTDSNYLQKKWSVSMYSSITAGRVFNSPGAAFLSPAIGVQLTRRLNNNLFAFTGISSGPAFFNPAHSFNNMYPNNYMTMPGFNANQWGINTGLQAGLMYVNDARTFSISGSIGVSNANYPFHPATQQRPVLAGSKQ